MKRKFEVCDEKERLIKVVYDDELQQLDVTYKFDVELKSDETVEDILDAMGYFVLKEEEFEKPKILQFRKET